MVVHLSFIMDNELFDGCGLATTKSTGELEALSCASSSIASLVTAMSKEVRKEGGGRCVGRGGKSGRV